MTEERKQKPDQITINVEFYEGVFRKCLAAAEKIANEKHYDNDETFRIAEKLFERFFADQSAVMGTERQTRAMVYGLHSVLENRNR